MKMKADRDLFRWGGWTYFTGPFTLTSLELKQLQICLLKPKCPPAAQAKPKKDGSEGEKNH